jgi:hypothetical protein
MTSKAFPKQGAEGESEIMASGPGAPRIIPELNSSVNETLVPSVHHRQNE